MKAEAINLSWLNEVLSETRQQATITDFVLTDIGEGTGFGGTVLKVGITFDRSTPCPGTVIVKLPVTDPDTLDSFHNQGILHREARFYRDLAPAVDLSTPEVYYVDLTDDGFVIVMEDLGEMPEDEFLSSRQMTAALTELAKLHAAYWNHPLTDEQWLSPVADGDDQSRADNQKRLDRAIELLEASDADLDYCLKCAHRLRKLLPKAPGQTPLPKPVTLCHGDFHGLNIFFREEEVVIFDWQLVSKGTPLMDVANLIVSSCEPEGQALLQDQLLDHYYRQLIDNGITGFSRRKLRSGFRDAMFFTFLKFLMVIGTIQFDVEGGQEKLDDLLPRLNACAISANAKIYCALLPIMFLIVNFVNLFRAKQDLKATDEPG